MGDQVYTPATITDEPFPMANPTSFAVSQSSNAANQTYAPATTQDTTFPPLFVAQQLVSTKLNTQTKKILGSFQFAPSGALKIGDFTQGVAGEIDLSPAGILAKNINGDTTFALDSETGDAAFQGTVQGKSLVAGSLFVGDGSIQIDGINKRMLFFDDNSIPSIIIGNEL